MNSWEKLQDIEVALRVMGIALEINTPSYMFDGKLKGLVRLEDHTLA